MAEEKKELPLDARLLSEAIIELNISRRSVSIYPKGHPSVEAALNRTFEFLQKLFELRQDITLGVAKDALIVDDYFLDKKNPVYREFANQLNKLGIAYITFVNRLTKDELYKLHVFLSENIKNTTIEAVQDAVKKSDFVNIKVGFIDYGAFAFEEGKTEKESSSKEHMWERYVHGLLEGTLRSGSIDEMIREIPPEKLAGILNKSSASELKEETYDKVITSYMRRSSERAFTSKELQKLMNFMDGLRPELKAQFLSSACKNVSQDLESAEKALKGISVDKVIELLDVINKQQIAVPEALKNLLDKFSKMDSEFGSSLTYSGNLVSDDMLLSPDILNLLGEGHFENFVTDTYGKEIHKLIHFKAPENSAEKIKEYKKEFADEYINRDFNAAVLELVNSDFVSEEEYRYFVLSLLKEQAEQFVVTGQYQQLVSIFNVLTTNLKKEKYYDITSEVLQYFRSKEFIAKFISSLRIIGKEVREDALLLCDNYGEQLVPLFIDILIDEEQQSVRRFILSLITHFGDKAVIEAVKRLGDERWYVKRNMLFILADIGGEAVLPHMRSYSQHKNPKVSFEATKYLLKIKDSHGILALRCYLQSESAELVEKALSLAGTYKSKEVVYDLTKMLKKRDAGGADFYAKIPVIKALGQIGDVRALDVLRELLSIKSFIFKVAVEKLREEIYMTLKSYPYEDVKDILEAGAKSKNEAIRKEAIKLLR